MRFRGVGRTCSRMGARANAQQLAREYACASVRVCVRDSLGVCKGWSITWVGFCMSAYLYNVCVCARAGAFGDETHCSLCHPFSRSLTLSLSLFLDFSFLFFPFLFYVSTPRGVFSPALAESARAPVHAKAGSREGCYCRRLRPRFIGIQS